MSWHLVAQFFAGAFLCNCLPHTTSGLMGRPFPTPFAKPPGVGDSSPFVNFLWGFFNAIVGLVLLKTAPVAVGLNPGFILFLLGIAVPGVYASRHFGSVRASRK